MKNRETQEIQWRRLQAGEYQSIGGRWRIDAIWSRMYGGDCWALRDTVLGKGGYDRAPYRTLKEAKASAQKTEDLETGRIKYPELPDDIF